MKISNVCFKATVIGSLVCSSVLAQGAFVGFEVDYSFKSNNKIKEDDGESSKYHDNQFGLGVKAGYDFDVARVYGKYSYSLKASQEISDRKGHEKYDWKTHRFLLGADYTPQIAQDFKLVLGGYTGLAVQKTTADVHEFNIGKYIIKANQKGWVLGAKIGGIYSINANNEVEFGYRADRTDYRASKKLESVDNKETNHGFYLGYNYKF